MDKSTHEIDVNRLVQLARIWLYQRSLVVSADRTIRDLARQALGDSEEHLFSLITSAIPEAVRQRWEKQLLSKPDGKGAAHTYLEWVGRPPRKSNRTELNGRMERIRFLKSLDVHKYLLEIPEAKIRLYGEDLWHMRPAKFRQLKDPLRTLRLVCFLLMTLRDNANIGVLMSRRLATKIMSDAYRKAELLEIEQALSFRDTLDKIFALVEDASLSDADFRISVKALKDQAQPLQFPTRAAAARWLLTEPDTGIRQLLATIDNLDIQWEQDRESEPFKMARDLRLRGLTSLPPNTKVNADRGWRSLIEGDDRERAQRAVEAAALYDVQRGLRNRSAWIEYSSAFCHREKMLINSERWEEEGSRYYQQMGLPSSGQAFLDKLYTAIEGKLELLDAAVTAKEVTIEDGVLHLPALQAESILAEVKPLREAMFDQIGAVQLPDLIVEMDSLTGFSRAILARTPHSEHELLCVYGGMLAHATSFNATQIAHQIPQLSADDVLGGMRLMENAPRIRECNNLITSYQRQLPITRLWGSDKLASSDNMSLDVSQRLWTARLDPRRNIPSIGTYTHIADTGTLIHDQPLVLGNRQAGAAIEGALRQKEIKIEKLAVDTHGYTSFAMGIAKLLGFDLCPRLKQLKERKLYLSKHFANLIPESLNSVVDFSVTESLILKHWDDLVRIAASIKTGQTTAVAALAAYGSASIGDPIYRAGVALGRLVRTFFLCEYFSNEPYRRIINRMLVQGESVHFLQRAIYRGSFSQKVRGQREPELWALSGSITLLTNLCIAWTTTQMQVVLDSKPIWLTHVSDEWLKSVSPGHFENINFNGTLTFPLEKYHSRLFGSTFTSGRKPNTEDTDE